MTPTTTPTIPGITITTSNQILNKDSRLAWLLWAAGGFGKTHLAGQLDQLCQLHLKKRALHIACESAEGGGAATLIKSDVPLYTPKDLNEANKTLAYLYNQKEFGGVVLDSATEFYNQHIKPATLKYPTRENVASRGAGVLTRSDYQVAGELTSQFFRRLMALTTHPDPEFRKHLIITATDQTREEDEKVVWAGPNLPGRMSKEAVQLFQQVLAIEVRAEVVAGKRVANRYLVSGTDGVKALKDRYGVLPESIKLKRSADDENGENLVSIWEKYFIPNMK